ncbi:MAG: hypothetical protein ACI8P9_001869 [Parasphingorhabdus sp.]
MSSFYIITRQPGAENPAIPTWANKTPNPANLIEGSENSIERVDIDGVPGAFQLLNLFSRDECNRIINITEELGYLEDAAVSLPRSIRHNDSFTWVVDDETNDIIWQKCQPYTYDNHAYNKGKTAVGLNARFRFYRYQSGDYFAPHTDGSWPGSRVVDGHLIDNAYGDRWSQLTILLYLSEDFVGGATQFYVDHNNLGQPAEDAGTTPTISVRTPVGGALCFPHGTHPQHCVHSSENIISGTKYIIRSDVLFEL